MRILLLSGVACMGIVLSACGDRDVSCDEVGESCGQSGSAGVSGGGGIAGVGGAGAGGVSGTGGQAGSGGNAGDGGTCDPAKSPSEDACVIDDTYGVFVSPSGDDASGDGTKANPFKTIGKGLAQAKSQSKRVYACATGGAYVENVVIDSALDGSELYGGFDCGNWSYSTSNKALIDKPSAMPLKVDGLTAGFTLEDFEIVGADASGDGASSFGAFVNVSQNVTLRRVKLTAGKGAPGAEGTGTPTAAAKGADGKPGQNACTASPNPGGGTAVTMCDGAQASTGGSGGNGADALALPGGNGNPGTPGNVPGGKGEPTVGSWGCAAGDGGGTTGGNGADGPPGTGATLKGTLNASGYTGTPGGGAQDGDPGQGGGGGGGAKTPTGGCTTISGASGGSGGGGGCGGKAGGGGGGGGASIALASIGSSVKLESCDLVAQDAGAGGKGGAGQGGGSGGPPGSGGIGAGTPKSKDACAGGNGGQGGNGGPGGGGLGGPSIAVAYAGTKPERTGGSAAFASPAPGGADGNGATSGTGAGAAGLVGEEQQF